MCVNFMSSVVYVQCDFEWMVCMNHVRFGYRNKNKHTVGVQRTERAAVLQTGEVVTTVLSINFFLNGTLRLWVSGIVL